MSRSPSTAATRTRSRPSLNQASTGVATRIGWLRRTSVNGGIPASATRSCRPFRSTHSGGPSRPRRSRTVAGSSRRGITVLRRSPCTSGWAATSARKSAYGGAVTMAPTFTVRLS